jgi:hypothetical protein
MEIRDARNKEWFWLDNEYLNGYAKYLGATCTVVYISLCRHADNKTQTCFPSMETMATENGINAKSVSRSIKKLVEWNIINVQEDYDKKNKKRKNNIYTLLAKSEWKQKPQDIKSDGSTHQTYSPKPQDKLDESHQTPVPSNNTHINNTHITIAGQSPAGINELIDLFKGVNPMYTDFFRNTTERKAIEHVVSKLGFEKTKNLLIALPEIVSKKFAPKITKPTELKRDLGKLVLFFKQESQSKNKIKLI